MSSPTKTPTKTTYDYDTAGLTESEDDKTQRSAGSNVTSRSSDSRTNTTVTGLSKNTSWAEVVAGNYGKVEENHCRVIYNHTRGFYKSRELICLKSNECRSTTGGSHKTKRSKNEVAGPGIYQLCYHNERLLGGLPGTNISSAELDAKREKAKTESTEVLNEIIERKQKRIDQEIKEGLKKNKTEISEEEKASIKKAFEDDSYKNWEDEDQQTNLDLLSLDDQLEIMNRLHVADIDFMKQRHAIRTQTTTEVKVKAENETSGNKKKEKAKKANSGDSKKKAKKQDKTEDDSSVEEDRKPKARTSSSSEKKRLYVIGKGHGGAVSIGFYLEKWDNIKFIVEGCSGTMFQKVKDEKEGFRVLREYLKTNRPSWLKRKRAHYPDLEDVRKAIKKAKTQKKKKKSYSFCSSSSSSESESSVHSDSSSNNEDSSDDDSSSDDPSSSSVSSSSDEESDESESSSSNSSSDSSHGRARKRSHKKKRAKHSKKRSKKSHKSKKNKKKKNKKAKKKPRFKLTSQMTKRSRTDESVGESRKLFGVSINNHRTLLEELAPSNAGSKGAKVIMEQIDDFTAFPRVQGKKSNSNTEEFRNLTEALTGTVQFWNGNNDNNYNDISRNVLGKISKEKTDDSFQNLATKLSKKHHSLLDAFKANIAAVLEFVYRITSDQSEYLAEQTLVFKIGQDTLNNYMSLLNYHVGLLNTWTWPQVQVLLKHHAENLWEIRNEFSTRDQVMCRLYTYLRDGAKKNWVSAEVLQEQLVRHRTREDPGGGNENRNGSSGGGTQGGDNGNGDDGSGTTNLGGGSNCSHCRTCCIHHGGKAKCPWKDLSKNKAVEGASEFIPKYVTEHMEAAVAALRERLANENNEQGGGAQQ